MQLKYPLGIILICLVLYGFSTMYIVPDKARELFSDTGKDSWLPFHHNTNDPYIYWIGYSAFAKKIKGKSEVWITVWDKAYDGVGFARNYIVPKLLKAGINRVIVQDETGKRIDFIDVMDGIDPSP